MNSYMRSLSAASDQLSSEIETMRENGIVVSNKYRELQRNVKRAMIIAPKTKRSNSAFTNPPPIHTRKTQPTTQRPVSSFKFHYDGYAYKNFALPKKEIVGAAKYYKSIQTQKVIDEELEEIVDQMQYPNPSLTPLVQPTIDPYLHIGNFTDFEINWNQL